ncbi:MAG: LysR family transcriptional regulator [Gammaproteobacteria bacterium]|nr:LysR family transcriptional regulator [Gammaproteobacteria bacterium]MBT8109379.1 LysR family transcriptional regulator [Gammaproteobacteria bacterium]NND46445.1 LysR family transcriptional regulator [Woeseiaceae bacterium]NNL44081.1 LysR family transcriptional regulator [Woeseiaceae bacterium]
MGTVNRNISLRAMRVFCVAAERESFRETAELLFLTSSAVSHQIKQLESDLGFKLFERTPRSLHLTADGTALYDDISPLIADFDSVIAQNTRVQQSRSLRISVQPFFASELFVPRLPEFVEQNPDIEISIDTSDESPEKHPRTADVSLRIFKTPPDVLACERLFPLRLLPAGTPDFYDAIKIRGSKIVSPFPLVIHESRPKAWREWQRSSRIKLPDHANGIRLDSMIAVARAAEQGLGAALVPKQLSNSWFESSALVQLFDHELVTRDAYYLVCRAEDRDKDEIRLFREWALQNFTDDT